MPQETRVGPLIRKARHRKRMTQKQLADLLRVNRVTVANWEIGKHFPQRYAGAVEAALDIELPEQEGAA